VYNPPERTVRYGRVNCLGLSVLEKFCGFSSGLFSFTNLELAKATHERSELAMQLLKQGDILMTFFPNVKIKYELEKIITGGKPWPDR